MFRKKKKKKTAANFYKCMVRFQMQWVRPGEKAGSFLRGEQAGSTFGLGPLRGVEWVDFRPIP